MNNTNPTLHIISFDVPFPPNYGGVIDVFYKIKHLHKLGVNIILHCYQYGRPESDELYKYCAEVYYYPRQNNIKNLISKKPYIVTSRNSNSLVSNLLKDNHPILFEGLHTTYPLTLKLFNNRKTLIRTHNIEHLYYSGLKQSASKISDKIFFSLESKKLQKYENILKKTSHILTISPYEHTYFKNKFGDKSTYIPVFYNQTPIKISISKKRFSLWHGDLKVIDNQRSLNYIIEVYKELNTKLIIASSHITASLIEKTNNIKNISIIKIIEQIELENLIRDAHIHPLVSFQKTGIKLRLLNILTHGKHLISNSIIIEDTGLEECVHMANNINDFRLKIRELLLVEFDTEEIMKRKKVLSLFNPKKSANKILKLLI